MKTKQVKKTNKL